MKALLLLASLAFGQAVGFDDFSGGLNTSLNGLLIKENESPALQNVVLDQTGGITRRQGYRKRNASAAIGGGSQDVNAVYQLEQSDGDRYCVAFSSTSGYVSTDSCQTFSAFVSTLTAGNDVNCDSAEDALFCGNGQYNLKFDGSNDTSFTSNPASLKFIRVHRNYCFASGNSTNPSRLYWSALGDCDSWSPTTDYVDVAPNDGDVITGIGEPLFDMLPVYKKFSTWVLKGNSAASFEIVNINKAIGALNHRSIRNFNNVQLFDSVGANGGQPGIYGFTGIVVQNFSDKLRNDIDQLDTFKANEGAKVVDSKENWDAGTFDTYAMSSSRDSGFMQSTYTAFGDDSLSEFAEGTLTQLSTSVISGKLTLDWATDFSTYSVLDQFTDGNYSADPAWTVVTSVPGCSLTDTDWDTIGGELRLNTGTASCGAIHTASTLAIGSWSIDLERSGSVPLGNSYFKFISNGTDPFYSDGYSVSWRSTSSSSRVFALYKHTSTGITALCSETVSSSANTTTLTVTRTSAGVFTFKRDGTTVCTTTDTATSASTRVILIAADDDATAVSTNFDFDNILTPAYYSSGNIVSRTFDTAISTPIWGLFAASVSSNSVSAVTFQTQVATSSSGSWDALTTATLNAEIASASKRFLRYKASYTTSIPSDTARTDSVTSAAASTGTWTSGELFTSANMSSWGLFVCAQTTSGSQAAVTYEIRTSTYSGGTASANYASQTCNAAISVSTGAYVQVRITFAVGVATETARVDAFALNWKEGSQAKSASAAVFGTRYHYGGQTKDGTINDVMYVLDSKGAWVKWTGVRPRFLNVVNKNFLVADSTTSSAGYIHQLYQTDSDDGTAISAFWESKDLPLGPLTDTKSVDRVFMVHASSNTTLTVTIKADGGIRDTDYTVDLSTGSAFGINNKAIASPINGSSFRIRFSNNAASAPWEVMGWGLRFRNLGMIRPP